MTNWQDPAMVTRWVAGSLLDMEKRFRRIMGHEQIWILQAKLPELAQETQFDQESHVA